MRLAKNRTYSHILKIRFILFWRSTGPLRPPALSTKHFNCLYDNDDYDPYEFQMTLNRILQDNEQTVVVEQAAVEQ